MLTIRALGVTLYGVCEFKISYFSGFNEYRGRKMTTLSTFTVIQITEFQACCRSRTDLASFVGFACGAAFSRRRHWRGLALTLISLPARTIGGRRVIRLLSERQGQSMGCLFGA
jgi:hypothetical protein